jgi:hypothetical protein
MCLCSESCPQELLNLHEDHNYVPQVLKNRVLGSELSSSTSSVNLSLGEEEREPESVRSGSLITHVIALGQSDNCNELVDSRAATVCQRLKSKKRI